MNKFKKAMTLFAITGAMVINMAPIYTYANVSENEIAREEAEGNTDDPEDIAVPEGPLTPDGNLTIIDDYGSPDKTGKQFITVSSKNGNIFYIIIDRDDKGENTVHFLNLVDERDILSLMDEEEIEALYGTTEEEITEEPVIEEEPEEEPEVVEEEPVKTRSRTGTLVTLAILTVCGAGVYIYFSSMTNKKKENSYPDPDADYDEDDYLDDLPVEADVTDDDFDTDDLNEELED